MRSPRRVTGIKHEVSAQQGDLIAFSIGNYAALNGNLECIDALISQRKQMGRQRLAQPCFTDDGRQVFVKTTSIESYPSRLRISFGLKRRSGAYDWPLAELRNNVRASEKTDMIPRLTGLGFARSKLGLVKEVFLTFENLTGYVNGLDWINSRPEEIELFIRAGLDAIMKLNSQGIYHLDLWAGNIMFPNHSLEDAKVIDLENCFIGSTAFHNETVGYQLALFYQHSLESLISENNYDEIIKSYMHDRPELQSKSGLEFYQHFKQNGAGRKSRYLIPFRGRR